MSDTSNPAPAGNADVNPNDLLALANSLPDDALDFDEGDTEDSSQAPNEPRRREPKATEAGQEPEEPAAGQDEPQGEEGDDEGDETGEGIAEAEPETDEKTEPKKAEAEAATVEIDGHNIPIEEVRRGFMRQADYTRKTMAVAEKDRQLEALKTQTEAERGELGNILDIAVNVLRSRLPSPPSQDMIRTDPMGFMEQTAAYQAAVEDVNRILGAQQDLGQKRTAEQQEQERQRQEEAQADEAQELQARRTAAEALQKSHPHLFTEDGWSGLRKGVEKHSAALGLDLDAFTQIRDPRAFPIIELATKFLDLQAAKPAALERVKAAPPIRPAVRQAPGTRSGDAHKRAMDRLRREGTIEAAAATLDDAIFD